MPFSRAGEDACDVHALGCDGIRDLDILDAARWILTGLLWLLCGRFLLCSLPLQWCGWGLLGVLKV